MAKIKEETLKLNILVNGDAARKALLDQQRVIEQNSDKVKKLRDHVRALEKTNGKATVEYKLARKELDAANQTLDQSKKKYKELYQQIPKTSRTLAELRKDTSQLKVALSKAAPNTPQWKRLNQELLETRTRMRELESQSKVTGTSMNALTGRVSNMVVAAAGAVATVSQLTSAITTATDAFLDEDEAMADAMKTTGLTKDQIKLLNDEMRKIDTRTTQEDLLALVRIGGKLGHSTSDELLAFARATNMLDVALKEDLGGDTEAAIAAVGKMVDIFQLEGEYGLEEAILKVGSVINELGMASTANEGYIVEFTKRLAGIAPNADISIDKVMGLAATLDKYGQTAEMSSTAIGQTIMALFKDTQTFASIAGMELKEFADILGTDVNEAFIRVLEGMSGDGGGLMAIVQSMQQMHLDGARASQVLGTLSKNAAELRNQQQLANEAFAAGSSLTEEFAVKNNTATAAVEKHNKAIRQSVVALGEELMPVRSGMMDISEVSLDLLVKTIQTVDDYKGTLAGVALTVAAATKGQALYNAVKLRYTKILASTVLLKKTDLAATKAHIIAMHGASAATALLSAAKFALAGNIKLATVSMRAFNAALLSNPIGVVLTAVAALGTALMFLREKHKKSAEEAAEQASAMRELKTSMVQAKMQVEDERKELERLSSAAMAAKKGTDDRSRAIQTLNDRYRAYQLNLDAEQASNEDIANAISKVNKELEKKIYMQAMGKDLQGLAEGFSESVKTTMEEFKGLFGEDSTDEILKMTDAVLAYKKAVASGEDSSSLLEEMRRISESVAAKKTSELTSEWSRKGASATQIKGIVDQSVNAFDLGTEYLITRITSDIGQQVSDEAFIRKLYGNLMSGSPVGISSGGTSSPSSSSTSSGWSLGTDAAYQQKVLNLKRKFLDKEIETKEEYDTLMLQAEIDALRQRIELNKDSGADLLKLKNLLADKEIALQNRTNKETEVQERNRLDIVNQSLKEMEDAHERERFNVLDRQRKEIASFHGSSKMLQQLKRRHVEELARIDVQHLLQLEKVLKDLLAKNKAIINGKDIDLGDAIMTDEEFLHLKKKLEEIVRLLNQAGGSEGSSGGVFSGTGDGSLFGVSQDQWEQFFSNIERGAFTAKDLQTAIKAVGEIANESMKIAASAIRMLSAEEEQSLKRFKKANEKKKEALDERLESGLISETQYNEEVKANDAEYEAFAEELAIRQAEREKAMSISQAIINTALGVSMTLAQWGVPWGLIPAGIMATMGAAEVALIASTPVVSGYESGGEIFTKRQQDGRQYRAKFSPDKRGYVSSPTVLVGEGGPEYVIPSEGLENPSLAPFINSIEFARKAGRLRDINFGAIYPAVIPGRSSGGYISGGNTPEQTFPLDELITILEAILVKMDKPTPAIVQLLGKSGLLEQVKHYEKVKRSGKINN